MNSNGKVPEGKEVEKLRLDDILKQNTIDEAVAVSIFDEAKKMIDAKAIEEKKSMFDYGADEYALEVEKLINKILMESDLTNEDEYLRKFQLVKNYIWSKSKSTSTLQQDEGVVAYKVISVQGMICSLLPLVRQQQRALKALKTCEKAQTELLSEIKKNMKKNNFIYYEYYFEPTSSSHSYGIKALLDNFKTSPGEYKDKSYKDLLDAYQALDYIIEPLKRTGKDTEGDFTPKRNIDDFNRNIDDFNKRLEEKSPLIEKNRDSTATKVGKIFIGLILTLSIIGIPAAYMLSKTKGEKLTEEIKEITKSRKHR
jgi:hypothetical protein